MNLIDKYLGISEGETKTAKFSKKYKTLTYWTGPSSATSVDCGDMKKAKAIVKNSGVDQNIEVIKDR